MPYYTYILKSLSDNGYYYGHTSDIENRLNMHNSKKVRSTKSRAPFLFHYFETFDAWIYKRDWLLTKRIS